MLNGRGIHSIYGRETGKTAFSLTTDVWDHYLKYRPPYPDALWSAWLDYHRGPLDTAHELGTGCGIGAAKLLTVAKARDQTIKHMILSDPAESNIKTTREMLQQRNPFPGTDFTFHQRPGEDSFLAPESVDMVIACECLHWVDIRKAVASVHASLRPGGTFAAVHYVVPSMRITDNQQATEALQRVLEEQRKKQPEVQAFKERSTQEHQLGMGLNFVPLDKSLWEDVIRTWVNVPEGETDLPIWGRRAGTGSAPVMIDAETETFRWEQGESGWVKKDCTLDHIKGMFSTTYSFDDYDWKGDVWKGFEEALSKSGPSFEVAFFATTFQARKK